MHSSPQDSPLHRLLSIHIISNNKPRLLPPRHAMKLTAQLGPLAEVHADWLIVTAWEDEAFAGATAELNERLDGALTRLRKAGDITGKAKDIAILLERPGM